MTTLDEHGQQLITDDKIAQLESVDGLKCVKKVTSTPAVIPYQKKVYGDYFQKVYQTRYSTGNYEDDMKLYKAEPDHYKFITRFIGIDRAGFDKINRNLKDPLEWEILKRERLR